MSTENLGTIDLIKGENGSSDKLMVTQQVGNSTIQMTRTNVNGIEETSVEISSTKTGQKITKVTTGSEVYKDGKAADGIEMSGGKISLEDLPSNGILEISGNQVSGLTKETAGALRERTNKVFAGGAGAHFSVNDAQDIAAHNFAIADKGLHVNQEMVSIFVDSAEEQGLTSPVPRVRAAGMMNALQKGKADLYANSPDAQKLAAIVPDYDASLSSLGGKVQVFKGEDGEPDKLYAQQRVGNDIIRIHQHTSQGVTENSVVIEPVNSIKAPTLEAVMSSQKFDDGSQGWVKVSNELVAGFKPETASKLNERVGAVFSRGEGAAFTLDDARAIASEQIEKAQGAVKINSDNIEKRAAYDQSLKSGSWPDQSVTHSADMQAALEKARTALDAPQAPAIRAVNDMPQQVTSTASKSASR